MEAKLKEYRAVRRRTELINSTKEKLEKTKEKVLNFLKPNFLNNMNKESNEDEVLLMDNEQDTSHYVHPAEEIPFAADIASEISENETIVEENQESWQYFCVKWSIYFIIWLTLYVLFLKLQFGAVFFVFSLLIGIYFNTRTRPKKKGEISAYSVFNQNCVSIDGTLKAEQFEREIRYGAGSVR